MKLTFGKGNEKLDALARKLKRPVFTFSLLSGHTCPYARLCRSSAVIDGNGKATIVDGPETLFRCFSASQEALFPAVYKSRQNNGLLVTLAALDPIAATNTILEQMPQSLIKHNGILRLHVGGDFQTQAYFDTWLTIAHMVPEITLYAYTKSLIFWVRRLDSIPDNFVLTASYGGYHDHLIERHGLRYVKVVNSTYEARKLKLPIDHDDSHAMRPTGNFALLVHGIQPKGSKAGKAVRRLNGKGSYGKASRAKQLTAAQTSSIKHMDSVGTW